MRRLLAIVCAWSGHDDYATNRTTKALKNWGPARWSPITVTYWDCRRCGARNVFESWQWEGEVPLRVELLPEPERVA